MAAKRLITKFGGVLFAGLLATVTASADVYEHLITRAQWPAYASGHSVSRLPAVVEALRRFDEGGAARIVVRYPGGVGGRDWGEELVGFLVSFGVPAGYLELQLGSGAGDRLVVEVVDRR